MSAMTLTAPAFAGGVYAFAGAHNVCFVIAVLGFVAVALTSLVPNTTGGGSGKRRGPMTVEIKAGLSYIRQAQTKPLRDMA